MTDMKIGKLKAALIAFVCLFMTACGRGEEQSSDTPAELDVTFIDVGKGDCIVAECGGSTLMIDTGYEATYKDVSDKLTELGISSLDALIITHYDKDHVGGAAKMAENFDIGTVYLPDYEGSSKPYEKFISVMDKKDIKSVTVSEDISFSLGEAAFEIFASDVAYTDPDGEEGNDNDVSLVVSASIGEDSFLFAGDIEKEGISAYLAKHSAQYDVLKLPHHGGKSKNSDDLIGSVSPEIAVITDSSDQPADDKLLALLEGVSVYRSSLNGDITVTTAGQGINVRTEK